MKGQDRAKVIEIRDEIPIISKGNVFRIVPVCKPLRTVLEDFIRAKRRGGVESLAPDAPLFCSFSGKRLAYRMYNARCSGRWR